MEKKTLLRTRKEKGCKNKPADREKYGSLCGLCGITLNLALAGLKLAVGWFSCSVAVTADALNNLSDAGASIMTLVSFRISAKPADRHHPFGHARMEYISSMVVSFLILLVGAQMFLTSIKVLFGWEPAKTISVTLPTLIILCASIAAKLWLAFFYRQAAKKIDSPAMSAAASDSLFDCISTSAVLICALVIRLTGFALLDAMVGLGVSVLIVVGGVRILNETKNSLLGEAPVEKTVESIRAIVARYPEALGIHDLIVHNYGPKHYIASMHIEVDGSHDIYRLHDMIDNMERTIRRECDILCTIHMDPIVTHDETVNALRTFTQDCVKEVDPTLSVHDFRAVVGATHTNLIFDVILPYESRMSPSQVADKISEYIAGKNPTYFCVITVDRG